MSEVKFYALEQQWGQDCCWHNLEECERGEAEYVGITDFDAQRLRADTAEAAHKEVLGKWNDCAHKLAAAEQRIASMRHALEVAEERLLVAERHLDLGEDDSINFEHSILTVRAALNPNPEAESHEPQCLLCLDKKTVPGNIPGGFVKDCPDCCGEEG